MRIDGFRKHLLALTVSWLAVSSASSHDRFVLPSHTLTSGDKTKAVSLIASISNDVFHPDMPLGNNGGGNVNAFLTQVFSYLETDVTRPDNSTENMLWRAGQRMSTADLLLAKTGTHRINLVQTPTPLVTFKKADGTPGRIFGQGETPPGATDIVHHSVSSRVETFVSHNGVSKVKAAAVGLSLVGESHPNDLFVGEAVRLQLMLNGKALTESAKVQITLGGTRHRNSRETVTIETDQQGNFSYAFPQAGFHALKVEYEWDGEPGSSIETHHSTLYVSLEVFPE